MWGFFHTVLVPTLQERKQSWWKTPSTSKNSSYGAVVSLRFFCILCLVCFELVFNMMSKMSDGSTALLESCWNGRWEFDGSPNGVISECHQRMPVLQIFSGLILVPRQKALMFTSTFSLTQWCHSLGESKLFCCDYFWTCSCCLTRVSDLESCSVCCVTLQIKQGPDKFCSY